ncbi:glycoside hydrolase family 5 protein [Methylobacterium oxalidis]|uniref:Glycosyl hydrolase family 5 n=1 Tax=Methylobacterium oxalidis TaxID=944322 RepID=A0A512J747_9HYPH|nr:cellulase family glycosylhydrolase [Methylobacterium oxalidis]GEP05795.1 glycosyl hydrolase family 5 [Methylobacterium oxalidis]GJE35326.1 Endoglucanase 3 [Methylobacterium oxalidis]GLS62623.1 glycosyl hydrolase family 5 [Methylobacterium oxalidis]
MSATRRAALLAATRLAAGLWAAASAPSWAAPQPASGFRRGVGVHTMMNWGRLDPADRGRYAAEPFSGPAYALSDAVIRNIAAAGFDFVRLTLDPGPFLQLEGAPRDALDAQLGATVQRFLAAGLAVLVDLHPNTQVPRYDPVQWLRSTEDPIYLQYVATVRRTARLLAGLGSPAVAFELMNEPPYGYDRASVRRWQVMCEALHAAVRAVAPDLLVVLTGAHGGDREGLAALDPAPFRGSRVLYSFHYYEPYPFTHQGVVADNGDSAFWRYFSDMPYPAASVPAELVLETVRANVEDDARRGSGRGRPAIGPAQAQARAYLATGFDRARIARAFDEVTAWAQRNGIPPDRIFLGEFGATRTYGSYRASDPISYENWLRDVRELAEERRFGWAFWALGGHGGMSLVSEDGGSSLDRPTLRALGMRTP